MTDNKDEIMEKASVIEWRGKVAAILEFLAKQVDEINKKFEKVVSLEAFNELKVDMCSLQKQLNDIILANKLLENKFATQEGVEAEKKIVSNRTWDVVKIILGIILGSILTMFINKIITGKI